MRTPVLLVGLVVLPRLLAAQCPDGTPPPCRAAAVPRAAAPAPDTTRIAIFPFRVTAADTLLGEGMAELLSSEFTGGRGPRAVHMGTVIRAWRQAGGGPREPLTPSVATRAARQLGAGLYIDGSVVGLGNRLTVTASVVSAIDGQSRRAEPIRGSADSLDVLLSRVAATLVALAGGEAREGSRGVLTASPTAMRAYVEGMSAWRRYRRAEANTAFEHALREDSTFARAALMRTWSANWVGERSFEQWARLTVSLRGRLSSDDRILLTALLGENYPTPRLVSVSFADRERAAAQLPESPEAQYLAGDWLYHYGGAIDAEDWAQRARDYLARSLALDSQQTVLAHLVDVAVLLADTALLRSLLPALEARAADMQGASWAAAAFLGDRVRLDRLRTTSGAAGSLSAEVMGQLPESLADEGLLRLAPAAERSIPRAIIADMQGHPDVLARELEAHPDNQLLQTRAVLGAMFAGRDTTLAKRVVAGVEASGTAAVPQRDCILALWHNWRGDSLVESPEPASDNVVSCVTMANLVLAWRRGAPDLDQRLAAADSIVRSHLSLSRYQGYESFVLARVWESQGNKRRALSATRLYPVGTFTAIGVAERWRDEGRLAAELGRTERAIQAYRLYLTFRRDPDPSLRPERDRIQAEYDRLVRQRVVP